MTSVRESYGRCKLCRKRPHHSYRFVYNTFCGNCLSERPLEILEIVSKGWLGYPLDKKVAQKLMSMTDKHAMLDVLQKTTLSVTEDDHRDFVTIALDMREKIQQIAAGGE